METAFSFPGERYRTEVRVPKGEWSQELADTLVGAMLKRAVQAKEMDSIKRPFQQK